MLIALSWNFSFCSGPCETAGTFCTSCCWRLAIVFGVSAVIPRKTASERYLKKAKKLAKAINSSLEKEDTVAFGEDGIFENGSALMKYEELENVIENRSIFLVCDGKKVFVLRKTDMVIGTLEDFKIFIEEKIGKEICNCG